MTIGDWNLRFRVAYLVPVCSLVIDVQVSKATDSDHSWDKDEHVINNTRQALSLAEGRFQVWPCAAAMIVAIAHDLAASQCTPSHNQDIPSVFFSRGLRPIAAIIGGHNGEKAGMRPSRWLIWR